MKNLVSLLIVLVSVGCTNVYPVTAPTAVEVARQPVQLVIRVAGPEAWSTDRLIIVVTSHDVTGTQMNSIVHCWSTIGIVEPASFMTMNRQTVVRGIHPGAIITCGFSELNVQYTVTARDWIVLPSGGGNGPAPRPIPVPVPTPTPPSGT